MRGADDLSAAGADVVVVMAKAPLPGAVKTRLTAVLGADAACALYEAFLRDLAERLRSGPWRLIWAVDPPGADLSACVGGDARQMDQVGASLGPRMWHCFAALFAAGARRVVMIGADVPHLRDAMLREAFAALDESDVALVPTRDGGYGLVALRAPHDLFSDVSMGNPAVLAATRERAARLGLHARLLEATFDIDELADVVELRQLLRTGAVRLPHSAAVLRSLALPASGGATG